MENSKYKDEIIALIGLSKDYLIYPDLGDYIFHGMNLHGGYDVRLSNAIVSISSEIIEDYISSPLQIDEERLKTGVKKIKDVI